MDPRRADLVGRRLGPLRHDHPPARRRRVHALRSRAARRARPRLHPPQQRPHPQGRALPRRPPPQHRRARRAVRLLVGARAAGRAAGAEHLRSDAQRARPRRPRARVARVRRAAARRRRPHQLRAPPPALVLPDQERRPARLRSAGDRGHRAHRALPPPGDAEEIARGLRRSARARCARPSRRSSAMVRLAEGLDRSHAQALAGIDLYPRGDDYLARLRATGDAELELWAAHRHVAPLEARARQADPLRGRRQRLQGA